MAAGLVAKTWPCSADACAKQLTASTRTHCNRCAATQCEGCLVQCYECGLMVCTDCAAGDDCRRCNEKKSAALPEPFRELAKGVPELTTAAHNFMRVVERAPAELRSQLVATAARAAAAAAGGPSC